MITTVINTEDQVLVETHLQDGAFTAAGGEKTPIILRIIDTYHPSGRKDCTVCVPRLSVNAALRKGV